MPGASTVLPGYFHGTSWVLPARYFFPEKGTKLAFAQHQKAHKERPTGGRQVAAHASSEREPAGRKREKDDQPTAGRRGGETTQSRPWPSSRALPSSAERRDAVDAARRDAVHRAPEDLVRRARRILAEGMWRSSRAVRLNAPTIESATTSESGMMRGTSAVAPCAVSSTARSAAWHCPSRSSSSVWSARARASPCRM